MEHQEGDVSWRGLLGEHHNTDQDNAAIFEAHPMALGTVGIYCRTAERSLELPSIEHTVGLAADTHPKTELSTQPSFGASSRFRIVKIFPGRAGAAASQTALPALSPFAER